MWAAIASTGTRLRWQSNRPLIRCRLPGPQLPAQTASCREVRLGAGGEGGRLLVPHVDPVDLLLPAQRIGEAVQRSPDHAIDAPHAGDAQGFGHQVGDRARHARLRLLGWVGRDYATRRRSGEASAGRLEAGQELHEIAAEIVTEIAAFLDQHGRQAEARDLAGHGMKARAGYFQPLQRIAFAGVEAQRHDQRGRCEFLGCVPAPCRPPRATARRANPAAAAG